MRLTTFLCLVIVFTGVSARRTGGGGGRKPSGGGYKHRTPAPSPKTDTSISSHFLNSERGSSSHNHAPKPQPPPHANGPIGFEHHMGGNTQGNHKIGFDNINSDAMKNRGTTNSGTGSYKPSAPPMGPPPAYHPSGNVGSNYGGSDHPPPYPGRPVNAPPTYTANSPHYNQPNPGQPYPTQQHFGNGYPQQNQFGNTNYGFGSGHPQQNQFGNTNYGFGSGHPQQFGNPNYGFGSGHPQQNQFGNPHYGFGSGHPQQNQFGNGYQSFGSSYPGSSGGYFPGYGNSYQGNTYGGSPFGGSGYSGNSYYSPNNFGYSSNPGYFGGNNGYGNYHKPSRFGGLPIPIPIPIPIHYGSGGYDGGHSYNHHVLNSFIRRHGTKSSTKNSTTSVFLLNNSTVTPCMTDHFMYGAVKVSVLACTAELCTAIKVSTITNVSNPEIVHGGSVTICLDNITASVSSNGENMSPTVSAVHRENITVCRNVSVSVNETKANETSKIDSGAAVNSTTHNITTTEIFTTTVIPDTTILPAEETTTTVPPTNSSTSTNTTNTPSNTTNTTICDPVECFSVEMCLTTLEIIDSCTKEPCPFRRTGYKPCVTVKMCRSPGAPISSFATLNTTVSKIDEYNHYQSQYDVANLTLISFHPPRPVFNFNTTVPATNGSTPAPTQS